MKQIFTTTIFLVFFNIYSIGQSNLDSLETLLKGKLPETNQVSILVKLAEGYRQENIDKSLDYAKQLLKLSQKLNDNKHTIISYNIIGISYFRKNYDIDTVLVPFQSALAIAEENDLTNQKCAILNSISNVYWKFGQLEKAFSLLQEILIIQEEKDWKKDIPMTLANMANILQQQEDFKKAKSYYFRALNYAESTNSLKDIENISYNLAGIYLNDNQLDSALIFCKQSFDVCETLNDKYGMSMALSGMAHIYTEMKAYQKAEQCLQESGQLAKEMGHLDALASSLGNLALLNIDQKKYSVSNNYLQQQLEILEQNGNVNNKITCYHNLSSNYEALKNHEQALYYHKLYHTLNDSIYNLEKNKQIQELETKYAVSKKDAENQLLKAETVTNQKTIQSKNRTAIALFLGLLLISSWGIIIYNSRLRTKKYNKLLKQEVAERTAELQVANKNLEQANYELRTFNYIASHDIKEPIRNIGSYAGLIFRKLPTDLKEKLGDYFDTIKRSTTQLYTLVEDFAYYSTLSKDETIKTEPVDLNLLTYNVIDNLQESIARYKGEVLVNDLPTIKSSNAFLFTALKNLIENGLKYNESEKPTVEVNYSATESHHQIIVSDNGIGIEPQYHDKIFEMFKRLHNRGAYEGSGIGLAIVKLVTEKLGGKIEVESEGNVGSQFVLMLPKFP